MNPQQNPRNGALIAGIIMFFVFGAQCLTLALQSGEYWWTPESMLVSLEDSADRVDVYVKDERLAETVDGHKLWVETGDDLVAVTREDIGFRLNNWDSIRASQLPRFGILCALFMAGIMLVWYGVIPLFIKGKKIAEL